ncbi:MAG TPA: hypothetical protein VGB60_07860 [Brevundimonas sp.]|jgi:hypothetical protein|uniref:hypothetical protein n=1 Tax=Brevundimonas sp. TaxID=1871086 RepID=UPI002ED8C4AC
MPHQNVESSVAAAQNAATDPSSKNAKQPDGDGPDRSEPRSYAAADVADSTLAPPAAGEIADFMDEGDALGADDVQQGRTNLNRPHRTEVAQQQGAKTREANQRRLQTGSSEGE